MAGTDVDTYVTPRKKLLRLFLRGREKWKGKVAEAKYEKKRDGQSSACGREESR